MSVLKEFKDILGRVVEEESKLESKLSSLELKVKTKQKQLEDLLKEAEKYTHEIGNLRTRVSTEYSNLVSKTNEDRSNAELLLKEAKEIKLLAQKELSGVLTEKDSVEKIKAKLEAGLAEVDLHKSKISNLAKSLS